MKKLEKYCMVSYMTLPSLLLYVMKVNFMKKREKWYFEFDIPRASNLTCDFQQKNPKISTHFDRI